MYSPDGTRLVFVRGGIGGPGPELWVSDADGANQRKLAATPLIDAGTGHGLRAFAGLVELCEMVVATDSLAFHVATALGRPTVVLVGPTSAAELDVFGRGRKVLPPQTCSCFYRPECRFASSCLDRLPTHLVLRAAKACLR